MFSFHASRPILHGLAALMLLACDAPVDTDPVAPAFEVLDRASSPITASEGGAVRLGGATLTVPPGALAEDAVLSLWETTLPTLGTSDDGSFNGQVPLLDRGFVIVSDRAVDLDAPLELELPLDVALLPDGGSAATAHVAAYSGGYFHPLGDVASASEDRAQIEISGARLAAGPMAGGPPRGAGLSFVVLAQLLTVGTAAFANLAPLIVSHDRLPSLGDPFIQTTNFEVRFNSGFFPRARAQAVADRLEEARAVFVDELGFELPNIGSAFNRYVVVLDDFERHAALRTQGERDAPDGVTYPGTTLWGGTSYVNTNLAPAQVESTAVHEYFHALQWGTVTRWVPNALANRVDPQTEWLFEGSATALTGRMVAASGMAPARDPSLAQHPALGVSMFEKNAHAPAADVLQDYFFFLERTLGDASFYRPMFQAIPSVNPLAGQEPSVAAVDATLRMRDTSLEETWLAFVRDLVFDAPDDYGGFSAGATVPLSGAGDSERWEGTAPPLSYQVLNVRIPALEGGAPDGQGRDITIRFTGAGATDALTFLAAPPGGEVETNRLQAGSITWPDARGSTGAFVSLVVVNGSTNNADAATFDIAIELEADGPVPDDPPLTPLDITVCSWQVTRVEGDGFFNHEGCDFVPSRSLTPGCDLAHGARVMVGGDADHPTFQASDAIGFDNFTLVHRAAGETREFVIHSTEGMLPERIVHGQYPPGTAPGWVFEGGEGDSDDRPLDPGGLSTHAATFRRPEIAGEISSVYISFMLGGGRDCAMGM